MFRRARVPVLTIGPGAPRSPHAGAKFHKVLYATDFSKESLAAAPYAISMAEENQARLILLYVMKPSATPLSQREAQDVLSNATFELQKSFRPVRNSGAPPKRSSERATRRRKSSKRRKRKARI